MGLFDDFFKNKDDAAATTTATTTSLLAKLDQDIAELEQQLEQAYNDRKTAENMLKIKRETHTRLVNMAAEQAKTDVAVQATQKAQQQETHTRLVSMAAEQAKIDIAVQATQKAQQQVTNTYQTVLDLENALTKKRAEKQATMKAPPTEATNQPQPMAAAAAATSPSNPAEDNSEAAETATRAQLQQYPYYVQTVDKLTAQYDGLMHNIQTSSTSETNVSIDKENYQNRIQPLVQILSWIEQLLNENEQHAVKKHIEKLASTILTDYKSQVPTSATANAAAIETTAVSSLDQLRDILQIKIIQGEASLFKSKQTVILSKIKDAISTEINRLIKVINTLTDEAKKPAFFNLLNQFYSYFDPILATPDNPTKSNEPNDHENNILKLHKLAKALGLLEVIDSTYNAAGAVITSLGLSPLSSVTSDNPFGSLRTFNLSQKEVDLLTALHRYTYTQQQQVFLDIVQKNGTVADDLVAGQILLEEQPAREEATAKKEQLAQLHTEKVASTQARFQEKNNDLATQLAKAETVLKTLPGEIAPLKEQHTTVLTEIAELEKKLQALKATASALANTMQEKEQALITASTKSVEIAQALATIPTEQDTEIKTLEQALEEQQKRIDEQLKKQFEDIATNANTAALKQKQAAYTEIIQSATQYAATRNIPVKDALITLLTERYLQDNPGFDKNLARLAVTHLIATNSFDLADMPAALDDVTNAASSSHGDASSSAATEPRTEATYTSRKTSRQIANEYAQLRKINIDPNDDQYEFIVYAAASAHHKNISIHDALVDRFVKYYLNSINRSYFNPQLDPEFNNMKQAAEEVIANKLFDFTEFRKVYLINGLVKSYRASHSVSDDDVQMIKLLEQVATELVQSSNIQATLGDLLEAFNAHVVSALSAGSATTATETPTAAANSNRASGDDTNLPVTVSDSHATLFATPVATSSSSIPQPEPVAVRANGESSSEALVVKQ